MMQAVPVAHACSGGQRWVAGQQHASTLESRPMNKPPIWFTVVAVLALLWNLLGLLAVLADLRLSAADIASLPPSQQAFHAALPLWSVVASVVAVVGGSLGCIGLLWRKSWAPWALYASLAGVIVQDIGLFAVAGAVSVHGWIPVILQSVVLVIALALLALARRAMARGWLS